jgi:hypothetical protein
MVRTGRNYRKTYLEVKLNRGGPKTNSPPDYPEKKFRDLCMNEHFLKTIEANVGYRAPLQALAQQGLFSSI